MGKRKAVKKPKLEIVFDEKKRKEFLTGFRKRKNERRKKAKEELETLLKEEKKRIKQEVRDGVTNLKKSYAPLPEVEELLNKEEFEDEEVTVKVVELSTNELAAKKNWLGENRFRQSDSEEEPQSADNESGNECQDEIPGMSITAAAKKQKKAKNKESNDADQKEVPKRTKKEIDRLKQNQMGRFIKNSKLFKMKQNLDRLKNRKKARQEKNKNAKLNKKLIKKRGFAKERRHKKTR